MTHKNCEHCGAEFKPRKAQIEAGRGRYCSHACYRAAGGHMDDWVAFRVSREQAEKVRELGGSKFLRGLVEEKLSQMRPARIEDVWRRA